MTLNIPPLPIGTNCFGYMRYSPLSVFSDEMETLRTQIRNDAIRYLFGSRQDIFDEIERVAVAALEHKDTKTISELELVVEQQLHFSRKHSGFVQNRLRERCYRIKEQLVASIEDQHLRFSNDTKLVDVGCGAGVVALLLKQELELAETLITDVVDYRYPEVVDAEGVTFKFFEPPYQEIDTDKLYNLGIITNTLHHCDDPFTVFRTMAHIMEPGATILVLESCIGVSVREVAEKHHLLRLPYQSLYNEYSTIQADQLPYLNLNKDEKMLYGIFFDWLFNRVFHNDNINVPYNFGKPADWNEFFESCGFTINETYLMGFDQPTAIEFHTLHLITKK